MEIAVIGMDHNTAPLEAREKIAGRAAALLSEPTSGQSLALGSFSELVILSTCNRFEIYTYSDDIGHLYENVRQLLDFNEREWESLQPSLFCLHNETATRHLFRVACGLESLVLGETQILGQIVSAVDQARERGTMGPFLSRLFMDALTVGKKVRTATPIGEKPVSSASAMARMIQNVHPDVKAKKVVIVGAGSMGYAAARYLHGMGVHDIVVINRTVERSEALAREVGGTTMPWLDLQRGLLEADIAIAATTAPHVIIGLDDVRTVMARRAGRPLTIVDLSVPRNVAPEAGRVSQVTLLDMDSIRSVVEEAETARRETIPQAEAILDEGVAAFMQWKMERQVAPTIAGLYARAEAVRLRELARAERRLSSLSEDERAVIEELTKSIVNKLLHDPARHLKEEAAQGRAAIYQMAIAELFDLEEIREGVQR